MNNNMNQAYYNQNQNFNQNNFHQNINYNPSNQYPQQGYNIQQNYPMQGQQMNQYGQIPNQYPVQQPVMQPMMYPAPQKLQIQPIINVNTQNTKATSRTSQIIYCKHCNEMVSTIVKFESGTGTYLISCCCLFPCALCIECCKDARHFCPKCKTQVGTNKVFD